MVSYPCATNPTSVVCALPLNSGPGTCFPARVPASMTGFGVCHLLVPLEFVCTCVYRQALFYGDRCHSGWIGTIYRRRGLRRFVRISAVPFKMHSQLAELQKTLTGGLACLSFALRISPSLGVLREWGLGASLVESRLAYGLSRDAEACPRVLAALEVWLL